MGFLKSTRSKFILAALVLVSCIHLLHYNAYPIVSDITPPSSTNAPPESLNADSITSSNDNSPEAEHPYFPPITATSPGTAATEDDVSLPLQTEIPTPAVESDQKDVAATEGSSALPDFESEQDYENHLAVCIAVKDQSRDLEEFISHHYHHHHIRRFYIMDDGSSPPLATLNFTDTTRPVPNSALTHRYYLPQLRQLFQQLTMYDECMKLFGHKHTWMAFLDADEMIEVKGTETLHGILKGLEANETIGALGINWQVHTSGGLLKRPDSARESFTTCIENPENDGDIKKGTDNEHVKTIVKTASYESPGNPHRMNLKKPAVMVGEHGDDMQGWAWRKPITRDRIAIHHYSLKSREEFEAKVSRGNGMSDPKGWSFWDRMHSLPSYDCKQMVKYEALGKAMEAEMIREMMKSQ